MSTIAAVFAERTMCSDSYWTDGDECGHVRKIYRVRGELLGFAGSIREWTLWLAAFRKSESAKLPRYSTLTVLRMNGSGLQTWNAADGWLSCETTFAIGSGGKCARGAMAAGASCREAVRIASTIDAGTGGPVRSYRL